MLIRPGYKQYTEQYRQNQHPAFLQSEIIRS